MKSFIIIVGVTIITAIIGFSFVKQNTTAKPTLSEPFKTYWYDNQAEITSYRLEQARYGEIHKGNAVLIFVTEPFSKKKQVKADQPSNEDYSVLKLNFTKKFTTGIYPYSMMMSSFVAINDPNKHAIKVTSSSQEWCGQVYNQINNKKATYQIASYSYFESEGDETFELPTTWLEDELWTKIRLNPASLPIGKIQMIPSTFYVRLMHKELKAYEAVIERKKVDKNHTTYSIFYPNLNRKLTITYGNNFPHVIKGWEETYISGWGEKAQQLTTKATLTKTIKTAYWKKNSVKDIELRKQLELSF